MDHEDVEVQEKDVEIVVNDDVINYEGVKLINNILHYVIGEVIVIKIRLQNLVEEIVVNIVLVFEALLLIVIQDHYEIIVVLEIDEEKVVLVFKVVKMVVVKVKQDVV